MSKYRLLNKFNVTPIHSLYTLAYLQYNDIKSDSVDVKTTNIEIMRIPQCMILSNSCL